MSTTHERRAARRRRIRSRIYGTSDCPRLSVYRSNTSIYAQLIDDSISKTLVSAHDMNQTGNKLERANNVGKELAKKAQAAGINTCVFDRGGFLYTGRVANLAEGARQGGLQF